MKRFLSASFAMLMLCGFATAQSDDNQKVIVRTSNSFKISPPIGTVTPDPFIKKQPKRKEVENRFDGYDYPNAATALPTGVDPALQTSRGGNILRSPIVNWDGITSATNPNPATPPDPTGAVGPNHYVSAVNQSFQVWNKQGTSLYGPVALSTLWQGSTDDGDPIVMYDQFADRWIITQFQISSYTMLIAVSTTPDPLGTFYEYSFTVPEFPDYPKFSIWHDGYYLTLNTVGGGMNAVVFDRSAMLAGTPGAQMQILTIPDMPGTGIGVLPSDADGSLPPAGTPNYFVYFNDDAWGEYPLDHLRVWEYSVDWQNTNNTSISSPYTIPVAAFDTQFQPWGSGDIEQPGTGQKLDAIAVAMMYRLQWRDWGTHQSLVCNHTVDVNGSDHAGIRWYELRKVGAANFTLHQEGTYAPDSDHRWMGSVAMDGAGNIGLAYSVSGTNTYPSLRYTGRFANDPLGQMTFTEQVIVDGLASQDWVNRWGDYSQLQLDPIAGNQFWFVGEYMGPNSGEWRTHIASFQLASPDSNDLATTAITAPTGGAMTATEAISINVLNPGLDDASSYSVSYYINGGATVTENISTPLLSGASAPYTFAQTADLSAPGAYEITAYVTLVGDNANYNDTVRLTVNHPYPNDIGVVAFNTPIASGSFTGAEVVDVTIENFGTSAASNFPVAFSADGGAPVVETFTGTIAAGQSATYTFTGTADLFTVGNHTMVGYTALVGDSDLSNDTLNATVVNQPCTHVADCNFGDSFVNFTFAGINNNSGCGLGGYEDFTTIVGQAPIDNTYSVDVEAQYDNQYMSMWIDFNDNNAFEPSELVIEDFIFDFVGSTTVNIPASANQGVHLLRIRSNWGQSSNDPCADWAYGETEDYKVDVYDDVSTPESQAEKAELFAYVNEDQNITMSLNGASGPVTVRVLDVTGKLVISEDITAQESGTTRIFGNGSLAAGSYYVMVNNHYLNLVQKVVVVR